MSMKAAVAIVAVIACGNSSKDSTPAPIPPVAGSLVLGEATVFEGEKAIWKLHANGDSEFFDDTGNAWRAAETFGADGRVTFLSKVVFRITDTAITGPDGVTPQLMTIQGSTLNVPIREEPDGAPAQVPVVLGADGSVTVQRQSGGQPVLRWRIEAKTAEVIRTAFLAFGTTITPRVRDK
jgi:hypothetical protein